MMGGLSLGELTTLRTGGKPSETAVQEMLSVWGPHSVAEESLLSQILEVNPLPKYNLSAKACLGILRRAERRGKDLPERLKAVLLMQSASGGCDGGGKGALVQTERSGTLGTGNDQTIFCMGTQQGGAELRIDDREPILTAAAGISGNNQPGGAIPINDKATRWRGGGESRNHDGSGNGLGVGKEGDPPPTLTAGDRHGVMCMTPWDAQSQRVYDGNGCAPTLNSRENSGQNSEAVLYMVVRRLTPLECTRLQGYPDGWVDIGDWTDEKGKKHKDADSPKYKALGNSIALPFWDWMLRRMARYLPENATLGSLFDGIGGFSLIWERIHGKGTARWASEIEPFPIAVTKEHFPEEE